MNEPLLIHDSQGYHVRLNGTWHHGLTRDELRRLLLDAHIDDAYFLVEVCAVVAGPRGGSIQAHGQTPLDGRRPACHPRGRGLDLPGSGNDLRPHRASCASVACAMRSKSGNRRPRATP